MDGSEKLAAYLDAQKLTQEQFAQLAGVPGPQVSLWLSRRRRPGLESALKIARATRGEVKPEDWIVPPKTGRRAQRRAAARKISA